MGNGIEGLGINNFDLVKNEKKINDKISSVEIKPLNVPNELNVENKKDFNKYESKNSFDPEKGLKFGDSGEKKNVSENDPNEMQILDEDLSSEESQNQEPEIDLLKEVTSMLDSSSSSKLDIMVKSLEAKRQDEMENLFK